MAAIHTARHFHEFVSREDLPAYFCGSIAAQISNRSYDTVSSSQRLVFFVVVDSQSRVCLVKMLFIFL
jgi:hypothetical protein